MSQHLPLHIPPDTARPPDTSARDTPAHLSGAGHATHPLEARSPFLIGAFRLYLRYFFWRRFHAVRIALDGIPKPHAARPLVIYCNHPSWWDPALILFTFPLLFPGRRGFGPMDAAELERYGLFRRMGLFAVDPASPRAAAAFLRIARAGLTHPDAALGITAEGAFTDPRLRPICLRPGLAHLARLCPTAVFLPLALEYSFWNESKPEALLRYGAPVRPVQGDAATVADWQNALQAGLTDTMDHLAAASTQRDPALFRKLANGTAGVGGIYDTWRRARATATGRSFDASHEPGQT